MRGADGIPRRWVAKMKASMHKLCPMFNTHRMVSEYWDRFYLPAAERGTQLMEQEWDSLKKLAKWREKVMYNWSNVHQEDLHEIPELQVEVPFPVEADIFLGDLLPEDVMVEVYAGRMDHRTGSWIGSPGHEAPGESHRRALYRYRCEIVSCGCRSLRDQCPNHPNHPNPESRAMGLVIWG